MIDYRQRIEKLRQVIKTKKVDASLITNPADTYYFTGFGDSGCWLVVSRKNVWLLVLPIVYEQAKNVVSGYKLVPGKSMISVLAVLCYREKIKNVVFDPQRITVSLYEQLKKSKNIKFMPQGSLVTRLRIAKDANEIDCIRRACQISVQAMKFAQKKLRVGITERQLVNEIEYFIRDTGGDKVAFATVVASGENSVYPHHNPGNREIKNNEFVTIDLGTVYQGYHSDLTRTIFLGKLNGTCKKIYHTVARAQSIGIRNLQPGIRANKIDLLVRNEINKSGFGKYFIHSTGHGVGLEIHELPTLGKKDKTVLHAGMVVTVEPGVYIPDVGGVRIEDTLLITDDGYEVLTKE